MKTKYIVILDRVLYLERGGKMLFWVIRQNRIKESVVDKNILLTLNFIMLYSDYIRKYFYSYEMHPELFRAKGVWFLQLTLKWFGGKLEQHEMIEHMVQKVNSW